VAVNVQAENGGVCRGKFLIAGGSEGIHKITHVFANYMEISEKRFKDTRRS